MEEDAGKLVHDPWLDETMVDYNRCGVPLLEIVSEPDMRSAEEVIAYLTKLRQTLQYLGVSDCRMQEGSLRADVNLSVRPVGQKEFGTRTEMKNINSFKAIARAIAGEYRRQVELIEDGGQVKQQTRRWDDNKDASFAMRSKENAQDYRYFPEPDLPPMEISQAFIDAVRARQPELAEAKIARYQREFGLPEYDARILTEEKPMAELFERAAAVCGRAKEASNWIMGETMAMMKEKAVLPENLMLSGDALGAIIRAVADGRINRQSAREAFAYAFDGGEDVEGYIKRHGLEMVSDDSAYERDSQRGSGGMRKGRRGVSRGQRKGVRFPRRAGDEGAARQGRPEENQRDAWENAEGIRARRSFLLFVFDQANKRICKKRQVLTEKELKTKKLSKTLAKMPRSAYNVEAENEVYHIQTYFKLKEDLHPCLTLTRSMRAWCAKIPASRNFIRPFARCLIPCAR